MLLGLASCRHVFWVKQGKPSCRSRFGASVTIGAAAAPIKHTDIAAAEGRV